MANMGALTVNVNAETAGFRKNMNKAAANVKSNSAKMNRALGKTERALHKVRRAAARSAKGFFSLKGAIGLALGGAGLGLLIKKSIDAGDSIAKTSKAIGISTDALQEYRFAADIAGVATETFDKSIGKFTKNLGELGKTSSELELTLSDLAPALLADLRAAETTEVGLQKVFVALAGIDNAARRATVAQAAFGRSGLGMVNMAADAEALRQQFRDLGLVIEHDLILQSEKTKDAFTVLGHVIRSNVTRAVLQNAGALEDLAKAFADAVPHIVEATAEFMAFLGVIDRTDKMLASKLDSQIDKTQKAIEELSSGDVWGEFAQSFVSAMTEMKEGNFFGTGAFTDPLDAAKAKLEVLTQAIVDVNQRIAAADAARANLGTKPPTGTGGTVHGQTPEEKAAAKRVDDLERISRALAAEASQLAHNQAVYGRTAGQVARLNAERDLSLKLQAAGIRLSERERSALNMTIESIVRQTEVISERDRIQAEHMERDKERAEQAAEKLRKESEATGALIEDTLGRTLSSVTTEFARMADEGEFNFKRLGESIRQTMVQIIADISAAIIKAEILAAINSDSGGTGGGSFLSSLGGLFGFGGGTGGGAASAGSLSQGFSAAGGTPIIMKKGGVVGKGGPVRKMNPLAFVGAPRFAEGGEVPAILHQGERVLTQAQNREFEAGGSGNAPVVINQTFSFAGDVTAATQREVLRLMPTIKKASVSAVVEARRRDPRLLGRNF